ncbi:molecular chaperone DnaJ [Microbulbifer sp. OS29]|uniref:Molecular chaperone DnaJ n=1 Tax=Microbulbifer okhotskensis TaxID=2926617 RepID=A0A9X2J7K0_9GAMM|nr:molecular chaperone DnaJ [Microbulbifer okhotskensis]MCO1335865.1 molecular chaperone DnaJ [Microbulbifer okhotskensis]
MARLILLILIAIAAWIVWQKIKSSSPQNRRKQIFIACIAGLAAIVLVLALSGRLHWVGAVMVLALPVLGRLLAQLSRYLPWLMPLFEKHAKKRTEQASEHADAQQNHTPPHNTEGPPLTEYEARRILGVAANAEKDDIIGAHRKLIQKLHPDRGGNDYLASRVNAAKELLLSIL